MLPYSSSNIIFTGLNIDIELSSKTCQKLNKHKQSPGRNEAGGMLFGSIKNTTVKIEDISTPSNKDRRTKTSFSWNRKKANETIRIFSRKGFHYLGDWHSHPQKKPIPSIQDINSIRSTFNESQHDLNYFIMFILSSCNINLSYMALTNGKKEFEFVIQ